MSIDITMPRLSDTMETGTIIKWNVAVGDAVSAGDIVADVETAKATMEMPAFEDGTIAKSLVVEGQTDPEEGDLEENARQPEEPERPAVYCEPRASLAHWI